MRLEQASHAQREFRHEDLKRLRLGRVVPSMVILLDDRCDLVQGCRTLAAAGTCRRSRGVANEARIVGPVVVRRLAREHSQRRPERRRRVAGQRVALARPRSHVGGGTRQELGQEGSGVAVACGRVLTCDGQRPSDVAAPAGRQDHHGRRHWGVGQERHSSAVKRPLGASVRSSCPAMPGPSLREPSARERECGRVGEGEKEPAAEVEGLACARGSGDGGECAGGQPAEQLGHEARDERARAGRVTWRSVAWTRLDPRW
jgi:hypothetical protein